MKIQSKTSILSLIFSLISVAFSTRAQTTDSTLKANQIKLNTKLFGIGLSYEKLLAERFTIFSEIGVRSAQSSYVTTYANGEGWDIFNVEVGIEGRYYYNLQQRITRNKETANNSANFWSLSANYGFKPFTKIEEVHNEYLDTYAKYSLLTISACWGIQRTIGKRFNLETNLGISAYQLRYGIKEIDQYEDWGLAPALGVRFGYIIL